MVGFERTGRGVYRLNSQAKSHARSPIANGSVGWFCDRRLMDPDAVTADIRRVPCYPLKWSYALCGNSTKIPSTGASEWDGRHEALIASLPFWLLSFDGQPARSQYLNRLTRPAPRTVAFT
jgi:hypothetical protein